MRSVIFTFDAERGFDGFTDGTTWNGWDNVWVTPKVRDAIVAYFRETYPDSPDTEEANLDMLALPTSAEHGFMVDGDGLVSFARCYTTSIVEDELGDDPLGDWHGRNV